MKPEPTGRCRRLLPVVLAGLCARTVAAQERTAPAPAAREALGAIELPGVEGRIDHLAVDLRRGRVFVAALGNDTVEVLDLEARKPLRTLRGLEEPQGILYLGDLDRLVVGCGRTGTCEVFDGESLAKVASVRIGEDADNLRYDAPRRQVLVAAAGMLGRVDVGTWTLVGRLPLAGHPESFQLDPDGRRAFVNLPVAHQVVRVDLERGASDATWALEEARSNFPMALLPDDGLVIGCRTPPRLLIRSRTSGTSQQVLELAGDPDDLFHDARQDRILAVCGAGSVDVFGRAADKGWSLAKRIATAPGARTGLWIPERGWLLVAVPRREGQRAEVRLLDLRE